MKSRKILCLIMCFALLLISAEPIDAVAGEIIISEGAFDYRVTDAGAEVIKFYNSGSSRVEVPFQVQEYAVVAIGNEVFRNLSGITEIVLPEGIFSIGDRAFYACSDLKTIELPISLKTIGEMAFCNCYALAALTIPKNVETIGMSAFLNCTAMTDLQVNAENPHYKAVENVLFSGDMTVLLAYLNTKPDTVYTIPEQVQSIGEKAFLEVTDLQEVRFSSNLHKIDKYAFSGCTALKKIEIPDNVEIIGTFAFNNCSSLTSVTLGAGVTAIPMYAFSNCSHLSTVIFSENLQTIGSKAFTKCGTIAQICIPDSVQQIAADAFSDTAVTRVRFYNTAQKEKHAVHFAQSQIICICNGEHTYLQNDPINCAVCDYALDWRLPPMLSAVTYDTVQLIAQPGFVYSYDLTNWRADGCFTGLQPNKTYAFYARVAGTDQEDQISDPLSVTTDRAPQPKAPKPEVESKDATSVTLKAVEGCEYSLDGAQWQTSPKFTGLQMNTEYAFYQRYAQTQTHYAGPISDAVSCKVLGITEVTSQTYTVQAGIIRKIPVGTTADALLQGLQGGEYCQVYKDGTLQNGQTAVGTGMTVHLVVEGTTMATYTLMITGDVNGDGTISITDMMAVKAHILDKNPLTGINAQAADTSGDDGISITDFVQIKAKILGKGTITAR